MDTQGKPGTTIGLEVSRMRYLPAGAGVQELHVIVTVRVEGAGGTGTGSGLAEVLVIDCSSSMDRPEEKFRAAKNAAVAALRMLPDGTPFAVVKGTHEAELAYPAAGPMPVATPALRADAERAVHGLLAAGGTCVGNWLDLSRRLLTERPAPIPHVLMLTDGRNEHDGRRPLAGVLDDCDGQFVCDAWGIGDGWDAQVLLGVTRRLHGTAHGVREEAALPGEYRELVRGLLAKSVPELVIRVATPPGSTVRYLKQVYPTEVPLPRTADQDPDSGTGTPGSRPGSYGFVTKAWGDETRRYQLCLTVDPAGRPHGEPLQVAMVGAELPGGGPVTLSPPSACVVQWTDDPVLSRQADDQVLHFTAYEQLGQAVARAADAYRQGRPGRAEERLGEAVALAHRLGARRQLAELRRLVEIHDAAAGRVELRRELRPVDFEHLITSSSYSTYGPGGADPEAGPPAGGLAPCPHCERPIPADVRFCPHCGRPPEAA